MSEVAVKDMHMYTIFIDSEDDLCRKVPAENHRGFTLEICRHEDARFYSDPSYFDAKYAPISREDVWDWVGRVGRHWGFERETIANETLVKWCKDLQEAVESRKMTFAEMPVGTAFLDTDGDLTFKESDQYANWCDANDGELDVYSHRETSQTRYMPISYDAALNWIEENSKYWSANNKQEALAMVNRYMATRPVKRLLIGDMPAGSVFLDDRDASLCRKALDVSGVYVIRSISRHCGRIDNRECDPEEGPYELLTQEEAFRFFNDNTSMVFWGERTVRLAREELDSWYPKFDFPGVTTGRTSCRTDKTFCEFWDKCLKLLTLQRKAVLTGDTVNVYFKPVGEDIFLSVDKLTLDAKFVTLTNEQNGKYVYCKDDSWAIPELKAFKTATTTVTEKIKLD